MIISKITTENFCSRSNGAGGRTTILKLIAPGEINVTMAVVIEQKLTQAKAMKRFVFNLNYKNVWTCSGKSTEHFVCR